MDIDNVLNKLNAKAVGVLQSALDGEEVNFHAFDASKFILKLNIEAVRERSVADDYSAKADEAMLKALDVKKVQKKQRPESKISSENKV